MYAFSVEVSDALPDDGSDWDDQRPYHFLCATLHIGGTPQTFWDAHDFYARLVTIPPDQVYTWNAVSFDWRVLYDAGVHLDYDYIWQHKDMMFDVFCHTGHPLSVLAVLRGLHMDSYADELEASRKSFHELVVVNAINPIVRYSQFKTFLLYTIAEEVAQKGGLAWLTKSEELRWYVLDDFDTVLENSEIKIPDNGWQEEPFHKEDFIGWLSERNE